MKKPERATKKNATETVKLESIMVTRAVCFDSGDVLFDVVLNGISIYGCKVIEGNNGDFIAFPQRKGKDGKYYSIAWAKLSEEDTKTIIELVENKLNG